MVEYNEETALTPRLVRRYERRSPPSMSSSIRKNGSWSVQTARRRRMCWCWKWLINCASFRNSPFSFSVAPFLKVCVEEFYFTFYHHMLNQMIQVMNMKAVLVCKLCAMLKHRIPINILLYANYIQHRKINAAQWIKCNKIQWQITHHPKLKTQHIFKFEIHKSSDFPIQAKNWWSSSL